MKRFFTNTAVKFLAFCLAALFSVGAVMLAFCAVNFADQGCVPGQRYEDSAAYRSILSGYIISAANLYRMQGEDLETSGLSFVDQQERQARREELEQDLAGKVSNFRFEIRTADGKARLYSNLLEGESFESLNIAPQYATVQDETISLLFSNGFSDYFRMGSDHLFRSDVYYDDYDSYYSVIYGSEYSAMDSAVSYAVRENGSSVYESLDSSSADAYVLCWGVRPDYPVDDALLRMNNWYFSMQNSMPGYICAAVLCALLALAMLVFVCWGAGRRRHVDGVVLRVFDRIPYEVVLAVLCIAGVLGLPFVEEATFAEETSARIFAVGAYLSYLCVLAEVCIVTTAVRLKARAFWRHTLLGRLAGLCSRFTRLCSDMVNHVDLTWKFVLAYVAYEFVSLVLFLPSNTPGVFFLLAIVNFFVLLWGCRWSVKFGTVRDGAAELARGNLEYRIETRHLPAALKDHAGDLNRISDGMAAALEEQMKSERLKSELITNVSHDIKTPLTSIINYVDLIKAEPVDNPKVQEYIAVLDRQSARLKKLTCDLVDASKASSGAMPVHLEDVDVCELLQQAVGEYSERLCAGQLTPVFALPEESVLIRADGALLWRVIDNLLSNICKYALPGTRVYISMERSGEQMTVQVKNVSRAPLNIPADELMERFVRGDSSRNSEGSGLGLSIAQSLTELMGGTFQLEIDGDLFKAKLDFPVILRPHG